jgi:hypothetical protein
LSDAFADACARATCAASFKRHAHAATAIHATNVAQILRLCAVGFIAFH